MPLQEWLNHQFDSKHIVPFWLNYLQFLIIWQDESTSTLLFDLIINNKLEKYNFENSSKFNYFIALIQGNGFNDFSTINI